MIPIRITGGLPYARTSQITTDPDKLEWYQNGSGRRSRAHYLNTCRPSSQTQGLSQRANRSAAMAQTFYLR